MKFKSRIIITVLTVVIVLFSSSVIFAQAPVARPERQTPTQPSPKKPANNQPSKHQQQSSQQQSTQPQQPVQIVSGSSAGHDYADLGLSVKWSTCNLGGYSPSDYGSPFIWGIVPGQSSNNGNWQYCSSSDLQSRGVVDSNNNLTSQYDVVSQNWGGSWRMPTKDEFDELCNSCKWKWTTENGTNGYIITGPNGNSIFLPATSGANGSYWSKTNCSKFGAYALSFRQYNYTANNDLSKDSSFSIRPVLW